MTPVIIFDPMARDPSTLAHVAGYELHEAVADAARESLRYSRELLAPGLAMSQRRSIDRDIDLASRAVRHHEHAARQHLAELERRRCRVRTLAEVLGQDQADRVLNELTRCVI